MDALYSTTDLLVRIIQLENENEKLKKELKELIYSLQYGDLRKSILADASDYANARAMRERYY